jgi:tetraacyldisaccharide 4'-kinase
MVQKIHYRTPVPLFWVLIAGVPSLFYLFAIGLKNLFYRLGLLREEKVDAKVICVGNLTTGGVGKTPIVCALANFLAARGQKVAVISRGYGGKLDNKRVNTVKDYEKILIDDPFKCGDEPYLIAENTVGAAVLTCRDRVLAAREAVNRLGAQVIILDDGFSNRKIHKDISILAINSEKLFGNNCILPLGPLREPLCEIERAKKLVFVEKSGPHYAKSLTHYDIPTFTCKMVKDKYYNASTGETFAPKDNAATAARGQKAFAFCAVGSPEQFYNYLKNDFELTGTHEFNDHHNYSAQDLETLAAKASKAGAEVFLTTEKDAVKLANFAPKIPLIVLKLKLELDLEGLLSEQF